MPIFEYLCEECDDQFEELVIGEQDAILCPQCGSKQTRKLISRCRAKVKSGSAELGEAAVPASGGSGCSGCGGGSCATCG
ncbi:MAG: zinc ribbon domain-containing protein [Desulfohalobiaceae bacterium]|nr:zinc ribbon domain-containing protein [Desulfohalobiaceae bacterium]